MTESVAWGQLKQQADDAVKPLEPATYLFLCSKAEHRRASTGSHMIVVHLVVQGGAKHGKSLMHNFVFTPDNSFALAMWFRNFAAFGIDGNFFAQLSGNLDQDMPTVANVMVGRQAMGTVSIRQYQGQDRNQFDSFAPPVATTAMAGPSMNVGVPTPSVAGPGPSPMVPSNPAVPPTPVVPQGPGPQVQAGPPMPQTPVTPVMQPAGGPPPPPDDPF